MMPKMDGIAATFKIVEQKNIPIIMLSAKARIADKIHGLSVGADDYMTKPFHPIELMARVKSQLRRYTKLGTYHAQQAVIATAALRWGADTGRRSTTSPLAALTHEPRQFRDSRLQEESHESKVPRTARQNLLRQDALRGTPRGYSTEPIRPSRRRSFGAALLRALRITKR